jgi:hypothetical protein
MPRHSFTDEQLADMVRRYQGGETATSLGVDFGCSTQTITRNLSRLGVLDPRRGPRSRYTPEEKRALVARYEGGESLASIARDLGCTAGNVRFMLLAQGVQMRAHHRPSVPSETLDLIRQRRFEGVSHRRIGEELGRPQHWVLTQCRAMGLPPDPTKSGPAHHAWKGGRIVFRKYVHVWINPTDPLAVMASPHTGYVPEHRLVMARALGRPLTRRETVHHINDDQQDNRLENLQLRQGNHGSGARFACLDCGSHNVEALPL